MKPPPFAYVAPDSVEGVVAELVDGGEDAKVLAGGQSLLPLLALRLAHPTVLVDVGRVVALGEVRLDGAELVVGAAVTHARLGTDPLVRRHCPLLADVVPLIAHDAIRNRGTLGGSLAHNDPAAELPAVARLVGAEMVVDGPRGSRRVAAEDFFVSYLTTAVEPDEVLVEVRVPVVGAAAGSSFEEVSRRHGDFALVGAGATVELGPDGVVRAARLALIGVAGTSVRAPDAERCVVDGAGSPTAVADAAALAASNLEPLDDLHASAAYRRRVAERLSARVLAAALADAGAPTEPGSP